MTNRTDIDLETENRQVLFLVQALVGLVNANLRAAAITCTATGVSITFVVYQESQACQDDLDDVVFEFEALQPSGIDVSVRTIVDATHSMKDLGLTGRFVLLRND